MYISNGMRTIMRRYAHFFVYDCDDERADN